MPVRTRKGLARPWGGARQWARSRGPRRVARRRPPLTGLLDSARPARTASACKPALRSVYVARAEQAGWGGLQCLRSRRVAPAHCWAGQVTGGTLRAASGGTALTGRPVAFSAEGALLGRFPVRPLGQGWNPNAFSAPGRAATTAGRGALGEGRGAVQHAETLCKPTLPGPCRVHKPWEASPSVGPI